MKKIFAFALVLVLALSLCACDSADYKKAVELYDSGDYEAAKALFLELGDYEDSAEMVIDCDYQQALKFMEDGEYKNARNLFVALGDHEDCKARAVVAARYMLVDYVQQQGEIVKKKDDNSSATVIKVDDGQLYLAYAWKMTGLINVDIRIAAGIDPKDGSAVIAGLDNTSSYAAHYDAEANRTWDISTYANGDVLEWDSFTVEGTTAQGTAYTQEVTMLNLMCTSAMKEATAHLEQLLQDSGLGLTMADIGFVAY